MLHYRGKVWSVGPQFCTSFDTIMIGKILERRASCKATLEYNIRENAEFVCKNLFANEDDIHQITKEMEMVSKLNNNIKPKNRFSHIVLSFPSEDRQLLTHTIKEDICRNYLTGMQYDETFPFIAYEHTDKDHPHIHILVSNISNSSGKYNEGKFSKYRSFEVCRDIENKFGLNKVDMSFKTEKSYGKNELEILKKTGQFSTKMELRELIDKAIKKTPHIHNNLVKALSESGVKMEEVKHKNGRIYGLKYHYTDIRGNKWSMKASQLGKGYSITGLEKSLIKQRESVIYLVRDSIYQAYSYKSVGKRIDHFIEDLEKRNITFQLLPDGNRPQLTFQYHNLTLSEAELGEVGSFKKMKQNLHLDNKLGGDAEKTIMSFLSESASLIFTNDLNSLSSEYQRENHNTLQKKKKLKKKPKRNI